MATIALRHRAIAEYHEMLEADENLTVATFAKSRNAVSSNRIFHRNRERCLNAALDFLAVAIAFVLSSCATGGTAHSTDSAAASRYSNMMHTRFYEAWTQPKAVAAPPGKFTALVDVQIDRDGRVLSFKIARRSGNEAIDNSIAAVGRKVTRVTPPPLSSSQRRFDLKIYFELDVKP